MWPLTAQACECGRWGSNPRPTDYEPDRMVAVAVAARGCGHDGRHDVGAAPRVWVAGLQCRSALVRCARLRRGQGAAGLLDQVGDRVRLAEVDRVTARGLHDRGSSALG